MQNYDINQLPSNAEKAEFTQAKHQLNNYSKDLIDKTLKKKADYIPEMFFIGQIEGGKDFDLDNDGLFVEANLIYGEDWIPLDNDGSNANF